MITNIIQNAIKFTPNKGKITAATSHSPGAVNVQISDTGIGISKEDLPHIFERFFKADKSRTAEGSGLGLAIAKHIVKAHGGEIRVSSQEGKGSAFSFSLRSITNPEFQVPAVFREILSSSHVFPLPDIIPDCPIQFVRSQIEAPV